jgi:hypothetical protein
MAAGQKAECFLRNAACRRSGRYFKILDEAVESRINQMIDAGQIFRLAAFREPSD